MLKAVRIDVDFKFDEFSTDITRALVAMRDVSFCAVLTLSVGT